MPSGASRVKTGYRSRQEVARGRIRQNLLDRKKKLTITVRAKKRVGKAKFSRDTVVALSNIKWTHLEQFDLHAHDLAEVDEDGFQALAGVVHGAMINLVKQNRPFSHVAKTLDRLQLEKLQADWEAKVVSLGTRPRIRLAVATVCRKSEAWARDMMTILLDFIKTPGQVLCHPELSLAACAKSAKTEAEAVELLGRTLKWDQPENGFTKAVLSNPGRITKDEKVLEVTGSIDFMIFSFPSATKLRVNPALENATTLDRAVATAHLSLPLPVHVNLLLAEAKRYDEGEDIEANLPQVLAQSYISMRKAGRRSIGWVLSNGDTWIFGVSNVDLGSDEDEPERWSYAYFRVPRVIGSLKERNWCTDAELDGIMERSRYVVKVLMFWCHAEPRDLWNGLRIHRESRRTD